MCVHLRRILHAYELTCVLLRGKASLVLCSQLLRQVLDVGERLLEAEAAIDVEIATRLTYHVVGPLLLDDLSHLRVELLLRFPSTRWLVVHLFVIF